MNLLEKIDYLIKENGLNKRQLSIRANIPYSTIDGLYKVGYENIRLTTFRKLCDYFGVTMDSMAYDDLEIRYKSDKSPAALTREEKDLLSKYDKLDDRGQLTVRDVLNRELTYAHEEKRDSSIA